MAKPDSFLDIQHATVYRADTCVFADFSFALRHGEHAAILGPNGGETSIRLFGEEGGNVWDVRRRLGIVSHDLQRDYLICAEGLNVVLSGFYASNDTYAYQKFSEAQIARAWAVIKELKIESLSARRYGHLSTGEQRRFLLARALVHDPPVLILDEPTSGLDLKACFQYLDVLRAQIHKGKTVLLVTHHLHEIPPEIQRVVLLKDGKIVADGRKSEVMTAAQISRLYEEPVTLIESNGWYQAFPAHSSPS